MCNVILLRCHLVSRDRCGTWLYRSLILAVFLNMVWWFFERFHVRRTDKVGDEAGFHSINEYMLYAEEWYDTYELKHPGTPRKVYIASDDPKVVEEARSQWVYKCVYLHDQHLFTYKIMCIFVGCYIEDLTWVLMFYWIY